MSACVWPYPAAPGVRAEIHQRFAAIVERATVREALPDSVFAEAQDDDVDPDPEAAADHSPRPSYCPATLNAPASAGAASPR